MSICAKNSPSEAIPGPSDRLAERPARRIRTVLLCALLLLAAPAAAARVAEAPPAASPRPIAIADYFVIASISDPRWSPDGRWIAYTVTTTDRKKDETASRIFMAPANGGDAVPMTAPGSSASSPRFSPDGRHLAFLAARDGGKTQVYALFREGGDAVRLTEVPQGVRAYEWSPDGRRLVLVLKDPTPEEIAASEGKEKSPDEAAKPHVITRLQFKRDYVGYLDSLRDHLYVFDRESKSLNQITSGGYDDAEPAWSPDGRFIAFTSNRTEDPDANYNTDLFVVSADATDKGATLRRLTVNPGPDSGPAWSPDGRHIAFLSTTDVDAIVYATPHLAVVPAAGGEARVLTASIDRHVSTPRFSRDGRSIYFLLEDAGELNLARIPREGGRLTRVLEGPRVVNDFDLGPDGAVAALIGEPRRPPEISLLRDGDLRRLTRANDALMANLRLGDVEKIRFESRDGTPIEAFVVRPPGFDASARYPALLRIHGGPVAQYDYGFNFEAQLFAANGYVVVLPNPRGSSGYGQAFSMGIWRSWGEKDYEDVMAAVDHAIGRGNVDPERLGVGGWSYGGMLTNHVITKTDRFKAAITGASATLYVANYGHDQYQRWWETELGLPWRNRDLWERLSPFNRVEAVVTPTLIVGGAIDWNVPILNSEQLYQALRRLGRTAELVVYPGQYHSISRPSYREDLYTRYLAWYDTHVKGTPPAGP